MGKNVFDTVARDYEKIHNRSLPPGVHSADFISHRAACVTQWISDGYAGKEFFYLDFGCGNGRMFKSMIESDPLKRLTEQGRLRLFGFDTSAESINEAKGLLGDDRVCLVSNLNRAARGRPLRFRDQLPCVPSHPSRRESRNGGDSRPPDETRIQAGDLGAQPV